MAKSIKINGAIYDNVDEIMIPKSTGGGEYWSFVDASNDTSRLNVAEIFNGNAIEINDINGEVTGNLSTKVTYGFGSLQELILPAVTSISQEGCRGCGNLRYVEMQNCVTIGRLAFYQDSRLEEARFPSCTTIGDGEVFRGCTSLSTVYFPNLTSYGNYLFAGCTSLVNISLPKITNIGSNIFNGCSNLETINAPLVTSINGEYVFSGCSKLNYDFSNITYLGTYRTFNGYPKTELYFPNVTSFGNGVFYGNTTIKKVTFDKITNLPYEIFSQATNFETLVITNTSGVCTMSGGAWFNNTKISAGTGYIYVPNELVSSYKAASGWSNYANQIKGLSELPQD